MEISYCRDCTPTKIAISIGNHDSVEEHIVDGVSHKDIGTIDVADDPKLDSETSQEYLDRVTTSNQASFV